MTLFIEIKILNTNATSPNPITKNYDYPINNKLTL